ncbi:MAG: rhodanese-like domain-containing protein [Bryobacteraceae bacterium]
MADTELAFEVTPREVEDRRKAGENLCLIDVREDAEWRICRIEGASLVPMNTVPARLRELDTQADITPLIVYCHHGVRSLNVVQWLRRNGVGNCQSMTGGIDRWSAEIDTGVPRY